MTPSAVQTQLSHELPPEPAAVLRWQASDPAEAERVSLATRAAIGAEPPLVSAASLPARQIVAERAAPFSQRLSALLTGMQASKVFSPEERARIALWIREFVKGFSSYREGRNERVSLALCFLLCRIIRPAMEATAKESPEELELMGYEMRLRKLLDTTVPEGETTAQFIRSYHDFIEHKQMADAKYAIILQTFQEAMNQLYEAAQRHNDELIGRITRLEERLTEANRVQQEGMGEIHGALEDSAHRVQGFLDEYEKIVEALHTQEGRVKELSATFRGIFEDLKAELQRLKK